MISPSNENRPPIFSMEHIGLQIMRARKKKGMTQMELADRMGISFQAVSNWERGQSCPDIAKLFELSELFDVSIDELLGNPRAVKIATEVMDGMPPALPVEELAEVAPLLDQKQADEVIQTSLSEPPAREQPSASVKERVESVCSLLPFASEETIDALARSIAKEARSAKEFQPLLPFMSEETLNALAKELLGDTKDLTRIQPLIPFLSEETINALAKELLGDTKDLARIQPLIPFLSEETIDALTKEILGDTRNLTRIQPLLPFLSGETVSALARSILDDTRDLKRIQPLLPFLDEDDVDALLRSLLS